MSESEFDDLVALLVPDHTHLNTHSVDTITRLLDDYVADGVDNISTILSDMGVPSAFSATVVHECAISIECKMGTSAAACAHRSGNEGYTKCTKCKHLTPQQRRRQHSIMVILMPWVDIDFMRQVHVTDKAGTKRKARKSRIRYKKRIKKETTVMPPLCTAVV